jgi:3',5'-cyclic AMP phosphodiesterase CpdA
MKIALAADLHFGSVPLGLEENLREALLLQNPDVVVIAGDLTLRARRVEFEQAATWLRSLGERALVIPGNHDLSYWNLVRRFAFPFRRYRTAAATATLMPVIEVRDGIVLGFNTAVSWQPHLRWQEGVARRRDIEAAKHELLSRPPGFFRAVAAHHPFLKIVDNRRVRPVRRAQIALTAFAEARVDLIMSGHIHRSFAIETEVSGRQILAVGAPTALSTRMRGEPNGFWVIDASECTIDCTLWLRTGAHFRPEIKKAFKRFDPQE